MSSDAEQAVPSTSAESDNSPSPQPEATELPTDAPASSERPDAASEEDAPPSLAGDQPATEAAAKKVTEKEVHQPTQPSGDAQPTTNEDPSPEDASSSEEAPSAATTEPQEGDNWVMQTGRWSFEEHQRFLEAMKTFGREWTKVSQVVRTRTTVQVRSHAQKYEMKFNRECMKLREQQRQLAAVGGLINSSPTVNPPAVGLSGHKRPREEHGIDIGSPASPAAQSFWANLMMQQRHPHAQMAQPGSMYSPQLNPNYDMWMMRPDAMASAYHPAAGYVDMYGRPVHVNRMAVMPSVTSQAPYGMAQAMSQGMAGHAYPSPAPQPTSAAPMIEQHSLAVDRAAAVGGTAYLTDQGQPLPPDPQVAVTTNGYASSGPDAAMASPGTGLSRVHQHDLPPQAGGHAGMLPPPQHPWTGVSSSHGSHVPHGQPPTMAASRLPTMPPVPPPPTPPPIPSMPPPPPNALGQAAGAVPVGTHPTTAAVSGSVSTLVAAAP